MPLGSNSNNEVNTENVQETTSNEDGVRLQQTSSYKGKTVDAFKDKIPSNLKSKKGLLALLIGIFLVAGGAVVYLSVGDKTKTEDANLKAIMENPTPTQAFSYSDSEKAQLRACGYSAEDISKFEEEAKPADELIKQVENDQKDIIKKTYKELSDEAKKAGSKEYQDLLKWTYLGGDIHSIEVPNGGLYDTERGKDNARYVKVPMHGHQCELQLTMENGDIVQFIVHPDRYAKLKDEGNMVVEYDRITYSGYTYYNNIIEKPIK